MLDCYQPFDFYRPQRSCGQGNIFTPICHSFCRSASVHAGIPPSPRSRPPRSRPPQDQAPPGPDPPEQTPPLGPDTTPREQTPPWYQTPRTRPPQDQTPPGCRLQHTVNERSVRILLECILFSVDFLTQCHLNSCDTTLISILVFFTFWSANVCYSITNCYVLFIDHMRPI